MPEELDTKYLEYYFAEKQELYGLDVSAWIMDRLAQDEDEKFLEEPAIIADQLIRASVAAGEIEPYDEDEASRAITLGVMSGIYLGSICCFYPEETASVEEVIESARITQDVIEQIEQKMTPDSVSDCITLLCKRAQPAGWQAYMNDVKYHLPVDPSMHRNFMKGASVAGYIFGSIRQHRELESFMDLAARFDNP